MASGLSVPRGVRNIKVLDAYDLRFGGGSTVFVLGLDKALQHIVLRLPTSFTGSYNVREDFRKAFASSVATTVGGDRQVWEYDTDGLHAIIKIVKKSRNIIKKHVTNLFTQQTSTGCKDYKTFEFIF
ncbi:hypothetical protein L6452_17858 [Arctium lappa]|uniref:Uncharacterized protein n=1 Tax=Arctium lappa TaxID=4217 RepID=A0ACB9C4Q1_ARCLA|nr:hypothetical protein L6452_17858 [Arctium lappa]